MTRRRGGAEARRVLVIAGLDPSGRAGLMADAQAIRDVGAVPVFASTGVAVQSERRLLRVEPSSPEALRAQVEAALEDGPIAAVKIGMVGTVALRHAILGLLTTELKNLPTVVDPVMEASCGGQLFEGTPDHLCALIEHATVVTPNLEEAARLTGVRTPRAEAPMLETARRLTLYGSQAVLLKGGHLRANPADLLVWKHEVRWFRGERIAARKRGTGCRLASALAAALALGAPIDAAVVRAREHVRAYLAS